VSGERERERERHVGPGASTKQTARAQEIKTAGTKQTARAQEIKQSRNSEPQHIESAPTCSTLGEPTPLPPPELGYSAGGGIIGGDDERETTADAYRDVRGGSPGFRVWGLRIGMGRQRVAEAETSNH